MLRYRPISTKTKHEVIKSVFCDKLSVNNLLPDYHNVVIYLLCIGVGLTINGNTVLNSSMILTKSLTSFNQLYCLSSAHGSAVLKPYWILPNGVIVNQSTSEFNVQASNGTSSYLFMSLSVNNGSEYTQGHYQCVIPDEYQNTQLLQVWIFREGFYGTVVNFVNVFPIDCHSFQTRQRF